MRSGVGRPRSRRATSGRPILQCSISRHHNARTTHRRVPKPTRPGQRRGAVASSFWALTLGSIGVVYGDIGTSPLYAFREAVTAAVGADGAVTREAVLGVLSLILWALIVVVTLKYVLILLRADNNGEGGTLALMALAQRALGRRAGAVVLLRHHQRGAVLWRCDDHAGALGAVRDRRPQGRHARASSPTSCRSPS